MHRRRCSAADAAHQEADQQDQAKSGHCSVPQAGHTLEQHPHDWYRHPLPIV
jgi:hypothetical protein